MYQLAFCSPSVAPQPMTSHDFPPAPIHTCTVCNKTCPTGAALHKHMDTHLDTKSFVCMLCSAAFKRKDKLVRHCKIHESATDLKCRVCHESFMSYKQLHSHTCPARSLPHNAVPDMRINDLRAPPLDLDKTFACETCAAAFKSRDKLKRHWLVHETFKRYKCTLCTSAFKRSDKLKRHMTIHDPVKRFPCPYSQVTGCTKAFNRNDKLKAHMNLHDKELRRAPPISLSSSLPSSTAVTKTEPN